MFLNINVILCERIHFKVYITIGEGLQEKFDSTPSPAADQPCDLRIITASMFKNFTKNLPTSVSPPLPLPLQSTSSNAGISASVAAAAAVVAAAVATSPGLILAASTASGGSAQQQIHDIQHQQQQGQSQPLQVPPPSHHSPLQSLKFPKLTSSSLSAGLPVTSTPLTSPPLISVPIKPSGGGSSSSSSSLVCGSSSIFGIAGGGEGGGGSAARSLGAGGIIASRGVWGGTYTCQRCGNSYARPHSLNRHMRFECGVEPKFECPICHKKSKHKHNLVLHMRTHQNR